MDGCCDGNLLREKNAGESPCMISGAILPSAQSLVVCAELPLVYVVSIPLFIFAHVILLPFLVVTRIRGHMRSRLSPHHGSCFGRRFYREKTPVIPSLGAFYDRGLP